MLSIDLGEKCFYQSLVRQRCNGNGVTEVVFHLASCKRVLRNDTDSTISRTNGTRRRGPTPLLTPSYNVILRHAFRAKYRFIALFHPLFACIFFLQVCPTCSVQHVSDPTCSITGSTRFLWQRVNESLSNILCRKPRGLLTMGLWTPMTIDRSKFLGVESGGGPEIQDEKMVRGVH